MHWQSSHCRGFLWRYYVSLLLLAVMAEGELANPRYRKSLMNTASRVLASAARVPVERHIQLPLYILTIHIYRRRFTVRI